MKMGRREYLIIQASFFILNGYEQHEQQIELSILRTGFEPRAEYLHFFFFQVITKKSMNSFVYTYFNEISKY